MKKVGIITMHKVWNAGSALQAYALQHVIRMIGYDTQLIDYKYPTIEHSAFSNNIKDVRDLNFAGALRVLLQVTKTSIFKNKHRRAYSEFYTKYFVCTKKEYTSRRSLYENPPQFDVYVTGSDQVWNPKYVGFDLSYLLDFAPSTAVCISYASSFSQNSIPSYLNNDYSRCLSKYKSISVREESGKRIIEELTNKSAVVCCDPTLLLQNSHWEELAKYSTTKIRKKFILVYIMGYAYDPYPKIYNHINSVANKLKLPIVFYNSKKGVYKAPYGEIKVDSLGPNEFLWLFQNAEFIITDSFHGTAFSLNFKRPFISVIESKDCNDSRVYNLLETTSSQNRAILCDELILPEDVFAEINAYNLDLLNQFRQQSMEYLQNALK